MPRPALPKRLVFVVLAVALGLLLLEGGLSAVWFVVDYVGFRDNLPVATDSPESHHARHDPDLGWVHVPDRALRNFYGPDCHLTINKDGLRVSGDAATAARAGPDDRFRLVCLGDSFTLGYGVDDRATYPAQLQKLNQRLQTINMGQGGYSVGQCYLWYLRDGASFEPDAVLFAMIVDDIWRMAGTRMMNGFAMPQFVAEGGRLRISGQPVPDKIPTGHTLERDSLLVPYFEQHTAIGRTVQRVVGSRAEPTGVEREQLVKVACRIIGELQQQASRQRIGLVVVLLPELRELRELGPRQDYLNVSNLLSDFASRNGILLEDLSRSFETLDPETLDSYYLPEQWHHFSEAGNRYVAGQLDTILSKSLDGYPKRKPVKRPGNEQ